MYDSNKAIESCGNRAYNLEHKEHYDTIIGEEWYIFVLQQVPRDFLQCAIY